MKRLPLADALPYEFIEPKVGRFWIWVGRLYARHVYLRREQRVEGIDYEPEGLARLVAMLGRGDGLLIAPNHSDEADSGVMMELSGRAGRPFRYMAAYQIFTGHAGMSRFLLRRIGAFPVDREGSDLRAFKAAVEILGVGENPLVVFPEGEIYRTRDRLTPLRDGAAAIAISAARKAAARGKAVRIVPAAIKYTFLEGDDLVPTLDLAIGRLEARLSWSPRDGHALVDRIYSYAEAMLGLKEAELLGGCRIGPVKGRIVALRDAILDGLEDRHFGRRHAENAPLRVKEIRQACLEKLADPATTPEAAAVLRRDLDDVFLAVQLFSYPGDYLRDRPSLERVAETLLKFEEDVLVREAVPYGRRRATVRLGEPIEVAGRVAGARPRDAVAAITADLEGRMQALLDAIGPGRPFAPSSIPPPAIVPRYRAAQAADGGENPVSAGGIGPGASPPEG